MPVLGAGLKFRMPESWILFFKNSVGQLYLWSTACGMFKAIALSWLSHICHTPNSWSSSRAHCLYTGTQGLTTYTDIAVP